MKDKINHLFDKTKHFIAINRLIRNSFFAIFLTVLICCLIYCIGSEKANTTIEEEFSGVDRICELATLKCFYHNVTGDKTDKNKPFKIGYKKYWIEYGGNATIGIDGSEVKVYGPDESGVVQIYVPEAVVLGTHVIENSINMVNEKGIFEKITTDEQKEALNHAEETMLENVKNDKQILKQAKDNAKELLKNFIIEVGELNNKIYTVKWIDKPLEVT